MVMVVAVVAVTVMEVGPRPAGPRKREYRGEREGDGRCRDGWSKRTDPQQFHAHQVYHN